MIYCYMSIYTYHSISWHVAAGIYIYIHIYCSGAAWNTHDITIIICLCRLDWTDTMALVQRTTRTRTRSTGRAPIRIIKSFTYTRNVITREINLFVYFHQSTTWVINNTILWRLRLWRWRFQRKNCTVAPCGSEPGDVWNPYWPRCNKKLFDGKTIHYSALKSENLTFKNMIVQS